MSSTTGTKRGRKGKRGREREIEILVNTLIAIFAVGTTD